MKDSSIETSTIRKAIRAPRGTALSCKGWHQEAALRMLMNSLDPEVAEHPEDLVACCGVSRPARDWASYDAINASLRELENDQTLLVQSGKAAGVSRTDRDAPRVLIENGNLVGHRDNSEGFGDLDGSGPTTYGQAAAVSWTYIGTQGALPSTYGIFAAAAKKHFGEDLTGNLLAGKLVVSGGMGGTSGAQPLAVTLLGGAFLGIDADPERIKRRVKGGYCDVMVNDLDEALRILKNAVRKREPAAVGLVGNCADVIPALATRGIVPDILTDQTSAHDPLNGYIPQGLNIAEAAELRRTNADEYRRRSLNSIAAHVRGMLELQKLGAVAFEFGNNIRALAFQQGVVDAYDIPEYVSASLGTQFSEGRRVLQWVALSGEPSDIDRSDRLLHELFPQNETQNEAQNEALTRWIGLVKKRIRFQGLPARACWLGYDECVKFGLALNDLVARGELHAPVVFSARGPVASTHSKAADSTLNATLYFSGGASWVSIQSGEDRDIFHAKQAMYAIVADGTPEMASRIERVFKGDDGTGIAHDADAG